MSNVNLQMVRTVPLLAALVARVAAITWTPTGGGPQLAFSEVRRYDLKDFVTAAQELLVVSDRCAWIIYEGDSWDSEIKGRALQTSAARDFTIFLTDRNVGDSGAAWWGDDYQPGVYLLADLLVEDLLTSPLPVSSANAAGGSLDRCWVQIMSGEPMKIESKLRDELVGRGVKLVRVRVHCGEALTDIGRTHC
jgi:hypothetical protein